MCVTLGVARQLVCCVNLRRWRWLRNIYPRLDWKNVLRPCVPSLCAGGKWGLRPFAMPWLHQKRWKFMPRSPIEAISAGLALVPEDRKLQGLVLEMAVRENMSLVALWPESRAGFIDFSRERRRAAEMIPALAIKTPSDRQAVQFLSGGNQQKVVLAKWLAMKPKVLLLDEPTRGIDVGAKAEIYDLVHRLAGAGLAVLFVSSEMEEILALADRALVMHEGRLAGGLSRGELSEQNVMQLAAGGTAERMSA